MWRLAAPNAFDRGGLIEPGLWHRQHRGGGRADESFVPNELAFKISN